MNANGVVLQGPMKETQYEVLGWCSERVATFRPVLRSQDDEGGTGQSIGCLRW
jgi:hypothetical protein